jgi:hypothetical protein
MTREEWDARWLELFNQLRNSGRSVESARRRANSAMQHYGSRPEPTPKPPGLSWPARVVAKIVIGRFIGKGVKMPKVVIALVYGITAAAAAINAAFGDGKVDASEILAIATAFATAAWGKFSNPQTLVSSTEKK